MVMGPTHSMSGATFWLGSTVAGAPWILTQDIPTAMVGAAVCAGACLWNDIDCPGGLTQRNGSTVVNAFGPFGKTVGIFFNNISLAVYNATGSKYDKPRQDGHRTLTHTFIFAVATGLAVSALASLPGSIDIFGKQFSLGVVFSLFLMWIGLHLALFGLAEKAIKRLRRRHGLIYVVLLSAVMTLAVASFLPNSDGSYPWLGIAFGMGTLMHNFGDMITRQGVPLAFPIKIRGKRWWDIRVPLAIAIRAGGTFEYVVLMPLLTILTIFLALGVMFPSIGQLIRDIVPFI